MFEVTTEKNEDTYYLNISGRATIEQCDPFLKEALQFAKEIDKTHQVIISMRNIEEIDIAFLQLIESLCVTLRNKNTAVSVAVNSLSDTVRHVFVLSGFLRHFGSDNNG